MNEPTIKAIDVSFHRNGVSGRPFYNVLFTDDSEPGLTFLGVIPCSNNNENDCESYVLCVDKLAEHNIRFGENSYRGDRYEVALHKAITDAGFGGV